MNKETGVWLDSDRAIILTLSDQTEKMDTIDSEIDHFHFQGGTGSSTPYGAQYVTSENKLLQRKKQQLNLYFNKIIDAIGDTDSIAVFGPAETKIAFKNMLENQAELKDKIVACENADSMTTNQIKALIKNHFNKPPRRTKP